MWLLKTHYIKSGKKIMMTLLFSFSFHAFVFMYFKDTIAATAETNAALMKAK